VLRRLNTGQPDRYNINGNELTGQADIPGMLFRSIEWDEKNNCNHRG